MTSIEVVVEVILSLAFEAVVTCMCDGVVEGVLEVMLGFGSVDVLGGGGGGGGGGGVEDCSRFFVMEA